MCGGALFEALGSDLNGPVELLLKTKSLVSSQTALGEALITAGSQLVELDLSDNAFGPDGVRGFEALLKSPACFTLQELKLNNCGMGIGGGKVSDTSVPARLHWLSHKDWVQGTLGSNLPLCLLS